MRIAVLGGTGCGGRAVVAALRAGGHEVRSIARGLAGPADIECDRADGPRLAAALRAFGAEILVDHVAYAPAEVASALRALGSGRYVLVSSAVVYGPGRPQPYDEDDDPQPVGAFAEAKYAAEQQALAHRDAVVLRLGLLCGPGHAPLTPWGRDPDLAGRLASQEPLPVPVDDLPLLQPWHAADHGRAVATLATAAAPPRVLNLAGDVRLTWGGHLAACAAALGLPLPRCVPCPAAALVESAPPALRPFIDALLAPPALRTDRQRALDVGARTPLIAGYRAAFGGPTLRIDRPAGSTAAVEACAR